VTRVFSLFSVASSLAVLAALAACASGGSSGGATSDGGGADDASVDGSATGDGGNSDAPQGDGGGGDGGPSLTAACADEAKNYCSQLDGCSSFLMNVTYGTATDCAVRFGAYCDAQVTAKGSGWTGAGVEACTAARSKLSCSDFLNAKAAPPACAPGGTLAMGSPCLFDAQCGTGYCSIPAGATCGTCMQRGGTGSPCATSNDCDGNLLCATHACVAPLPLGAPCTPGMTPCLSGLACITGKCAAPGVAGAACSADAGGVDCASNLGAYCDGMACQAISVAMIPALCGDSPPTACYADGACVGGACQAPVPDGQTCTPDSGVNCTYPSVCGAAGTCVTPQASMCP
jgi:hypothetical protein